MSANTRHRGLIAKQLHPHLYLSTLSPASVVAGRYGRARHFARPLSDQPTARAALAASFLPTRPSSSTWSSSRLRREAAHRAARARASRPSRVEGRPTLVRLSSLLLPAADRRTPGRGRLGGADGVPRTSARCNSKFCVSPVRARLRGRVARPVPPGAHGGSALGFPPFGERNLFRAPSALSVLNTERKL